MSELEDLAGPLMRILAATPRGPRRDGTFALWVTTRVALDIVSDDGIGERAHQRRVLALEKRLSSLTVPVPLRRALSGTLALLREGSPEAATAGLLQLVPSARESLGPEAGEALARAARAAQVAQSAQRGRSDSA